MTEVIAGRQNGAGEKVLAYLTGNADRPVTAEEIVTHTGLSRMTVSNACTQLRVKFPGQLKLKGKGIHLWTSEATEARAGEFVTLRIIEERADRFLASDDEAGTLFVVRQVEW